MSIQPVISKGATLNTHMVYSDSTEIDEVIRKEIEALAQEALSGLEVINSENLEVTENDLDRMAKIFQQTA